MLPKNLQGCFKHFGYQPGDFSESEKATAEVLALPIYAELTEDQQRYIVQSIAELV